MAMYATIDIPKAEFAESAIELSTLPWVRNRVATLTVANSNVRIDSYGFAGHLAIGTSHTIEVRELVPGTVHALFPIATHQRIRVARQSTRTDPRSEPPHELIARSFISAALEATASGIDRRYEASRYLGEQPSGRLDTARTMKAWATGRRNVLATSIRRLTPDTPLNRVLAAGALRAYEITAYSDTASLGGALCARLAGVTPQVLPDFEHARRYAVMAGRGEDVALVDIAELLITGMTLVGSGAALTSPMSAWVDVPDLFERAVLALTSTLFSPAHVFHGKSSPRALLKRGDAATRLRRAEPDVVIQNGSRTVIFDAKYRSTGNVASEQSLYQLMAHADAWNATAAALVTPALPGQSPGVEVLGTDSRGCTYAVLSADPTNVGELSSALSWSTAFKALRIATPS